MNTVFRKQFYPFPNWLNWHGTLTLPLELFYPPLGSPDPHPEAHPGEWGGLWLKVRLSNRAEERWDPPESMWGEVCGICALLLNHTSEQHPKRSLCLVVWETFLRGSVTLFVTWKVSESAN